MSAFETVMAITNVVAVIAIPIAAVFVGQKLQDRSEKRKDKMVIFRCLMTHRATGWAHQDTVNALNTIDIVFADSKAVRKQWGVLFSKYRKEFSPQEQYLEQCKLLELMANDLGYKKKITWETIQNPYFPGGLVQRMENAAKYEQGQLAMAELMMNMSGNPLEFGNIVQQQAAKQEKIDHVNP